MYSAIDVLAAIEPAAVTRALADRERFRPFLSRAETFARENKMVVGGRAAMLMCTQSAPKHGDFGLELYSSKPGSHARALADALYAVDPKGLGHYACASTRTPDTEYVVSLDGRDVIKILALVVYRFANVAEIVKPASLTPVFGSGVRQACMGPDLLLVSVYARLSDPGQAADWMELVETEAGLRAQLFRIWRPVKDGGEWADTPSRDWLDKLARFRAAVVAEFRSGPRRAMVGAGGLALLREHFTKGEAKMVDDKTAKLQYVTSAPFHDEASVLQKLAEAVGLTASAQENDLLVPTDPELKRLTLTVTDGAARRDVVVYLYNLAARELVPYNAVVCGSISYRVATLPVLLRISLVELWTSQLLLNIKAITPGYSKALAYQAIANLTEAGRLFDKILKDAKFGDIFVETYIGSCVDAEIARKRVANAAMMDKKRERWRLLPYYPAKKHASTVK
jgi:hypothetical protein